MPAHLHQLQDTPLPPSDDDDEDLTDDQIQALLRDAEVRIRDRNSTSTKDTSFKGLPKLHADAVEKPYIQNEGDVARIDQSRLLPGDQRKLANRIRTVEDPIAVKKRAVTVL